MAPARKMPLSGISGAVSEPSTTRQNTLTEFPVSEVPVVVCGDGFVFVHPAGVAIVPVSSETATPVRAAP